MHRIGRRAVFVVCLAALLGAVAACGGAPTVPGKWQAADNPEAGFEIKTDGTFQGELGPAGDRRIRLGGTWVAKGNEVTFTLEAGPAQGLGPLIGTIAGDTMTVTSPAQGPGNVTLKRRG
jgi:hypothetical protein